MTSAELRMIRRQRARESERPEQTVRPRLDYSGRVPMAPRLDQIDKQDDRRFR